jgi:hypothetical protein
MRRQVIYGEKNVWTGVDGKIKELRYGRMKILVFLWREGNRIRAGTGADVTAEILCFWMRESMKPFMESD